MLKDAVKNRFDVLVVVRIDRLARSTVNLLHILQQLHSAGVGFVTTAQQIDTTTPYGRMVLTFLGAIAEFERELIRDRIFFRNCKSQGTGNPIWATTCAIKSGRSGQFKGVWDEYSGDSEGIGLGIGTIHRALSAVPKASPK
jgi:hypothetical protein